MRAVSDFLQQHMGGHVNVGRRLTIYGFNAMHVSFQFWTRRWGYICFHPPIPKWALGARWPWYLYISPNATPWAATFGIGPGIDMDDREGIAWRRENLGHGFNSEPLDYNDMQPPRLRKVGP